MSTYPETSGRKPIWVVPREHDPVPVAGSERLDQGALELGAGIPGLTVDDEGTPSNRTVLIEDGVLVGFLQDRQNARLMGVTPTGNGRRQIA